MPGHLDEDKRDMTTGRRREELLDAATSSPIQVHTRVCIDLPPKQYVTLLASYINENTVTANINEVLMAKKSIERNILPIRKGNNGGSRDTQAQPAMRGSWKFSLSLVQCEDIYQESCYHCLLPSISCILNYTSFLRHSSGHTIRPRFSLQWLSSEWQPRLCVWAAKTTFRRSVPRSLWSISFSESFPRWHPIASYQVTRPLFISQDERL